MPINKIGFIVYCLFSLCKLEETRFFSMLHTLYRVKTNLCYSHFRVSFHWSWYLNYFWSPIRLQVSKVIKTNSKFTFLFIFVHTNKNKLFISRLYFIISNEMFVPMFKNKIILGNLYIFSLDALSIGNDTWI